MNVKYVGPAKDYSGYGEAVRHDIAALLAAGIGVTGHFPRYTGEIADFGALAEMVYSVEEKPLEYGTILLHTTPNVYGKYFEPGKRHIARVFWETDKLPKEFAENIELCDEVWTGSEYNKQAIIKAGVTKPIYIIPEAIDTSYVAGSAKPYLVPNQDTFKFYSIFEWTERKNPLALLTAYWQEFENTEGVSLSIKTYVDNFTKEKREEIDNQIQTLKLRLGLKRYAPLFLYRHLMDRHQIYRFHETFDCFVSAHRGEGWGIPQMEAMLCEKPVISTNCGGIHEYLKDYQYFVPYKLVPLSGNSRNQQWYTPDQQWADVDISLLRTAMRLSYKDEKATKNMGISGGQRVRDLFNFEAVGKLMQKRLVPSPSQNGNDAIL